MIIKDKSFSRAFQNFRIVLFYTKLLRWGFRFGQTKTVKMKKVSVDLKRMFLKELREEEIRGVETFTK